MVPAYNEEQNILPTIGKLAEELRAEQIPFELVIVNDNSQDDTPRVVENAVRDYPEIRLVHNTPPGGLGRAVRFGLKHFTGD
ncbi:MAG: glycosyltransferase, partial [Candidatus Hydrogenedentes bacterium]|nr:glycosyltransferase [Candidatus Hydrogenedentota bacterium]